MNGISPGSPLTIHISCTIPLHPHLLATSLLPSGSRSMIDIWLTVRGWFPSVHIPASAKSSQADPIIPIIYRIQKHPKDPNIASGDLVRALHCTLGVIAGTCRGWPMKTGKPSAERHLSSRAQRAPVSKEQVPGSLYPSPSAERNIEGLHSHSRWSIFGDWKPIGVFQCTAHGGGPLLKGNVKFCKYAPRHSRGDMSQRRRCYAWNDAVSQAQVSDTEFLQLHVF
jgi:hypothetical protein